MAKRESASGSGTRSAGSTRRTLLRAALGSVAAPVLGATLASRGRAREAPSANPFAGLRKDHPRLMATGEVLQRVKQMLKSDPAAAADYQRLIERTRTILTMAHLKYPTSTLESLSASIAAPREIRATPLDHLPRAGTYLAALDDPANAPGGGILESLGFKVKGNVPLALARPGLSRIQALGLVWQLTAERQYLDRAKSELLNVCDIKNFHWGTEFLATATFMQMAALGYDWLHSELSEDERRTVRTALLERGIKIALDQYQSKSRPAWITKPNNWNIVCNASVMMAALALHGDTEDPRIAGAFQFALASIRTGFRNFSPDGSWKQEGPGYWHLAAEHAAYLLDSLESALGHDFRLARTAGFSETGFYRLHMGGPTGKLFNYGDSEDRHLGLWWMRWLGRECKEPLYVAMAEGRSPASGAEDEVHPMDILWRGPASPPPAKQEPLAKIFAETAVLRGSWSDIKGTYIGLKGGTTTKGREHSHLDLGSFVLDAIGQRWAVELGPPKDYTECYLQPPERYQFYRASTLGHNTLVVNGGNQKVPAAAKFGTLRERKGRSSVSLDMSAAYPACERVVRHIALSAGRYVTIVDDIEPRGRLEQVDWQMHTTAQIDCSGRRAILTIAEDGGAQSRLYAWVFGPADVVFVTEVVHQPPPEPAVGLDCGPDPINGVRKLVARLTKVRKATRITVVLSPDPRPPRRVFSPRSPRG